MSLESRITKFPRFPKFLKFPKFPKFSDKQSVKDCPTPQETICCQKGSYVVVGRRLPKRSIHNVCEHLAGKPNAADVPLITGNNLLSEGVMCGSGSQTAKAEHT